MTKPCYLAALIVFLLAPAPRALAQEPPEPKVVVSIAPVYSLVAGVMRGVATPELLVEGGGSPHGYMLRPSEARMLARADLVVWVGPALESFLEKPLKNLGREARSLELMEAFSEHLLPLREGGDWDSHAEGEDRSADPDDEHGHHDHHAHGEGGFNPHLWLDPLLARKIVSETAEALAGIDPDRAAAYRQNEARLHGRLDALYRHLEAELEPVREIPYVVFHDAYPYFEKAFGLNPVGSITIDPERKPGARRISEIREKIRELDARCVFSEPQFRPRLVSTVVEGTGARTGTLDPLGAELEATEESYFRLMQNLADDLTAGLR